MVNNVKDPTLRAILKYKDHPSILAIQNKCKNGIKFAFEEMDLASIEKESHNLKIDKASPSLDIQTKIIKENVDIFVEFLWKSINSSNKSFTFPSCLKSPDVTPLQQKGKKDRKENYRPVTILPTLPTCLVRSLLISIRYFRNINIVSERGTVPQGSILGSMLFNIFFADLFLILNKTYIANYADE